MPTLFASVRVPGINYTISGTAIETKLGGSYEMISLWCSFLCGFMLL